MTSSELKEDITSMGKTKAFWKANTKKIKKELLDLSEIEKKKKKNWIFLEGKFKLISWEVRKKFKGT
jgi:hypothetical protein